MWLVYLHARNAHRRILLYVMLAHAAHISKMVPAMLVEKDAKSAQMPILVLLVINSIVWLMGFARLMIVRSPAQNVEQLMGTMSVLNATAVMLSQIQTNARLISHA